MCFLICIKGLANMDFLRADDDIGIFTSRFLIIADICGDSVNMVDVT